MNNLREYLFILFIQFNQFILTSDWMNWMN